MPLTSDSRTESENPEGLALAGPGGHRGELVKALANVTRDLTDAGITKFLNSDPQELLDGVLTAKLQSLLREVVGWRESEEQQQFRLTDFAYKGLTELTLKDFVTGDPVMRAAVDSLRERAAGDQPIFLVGETGVGKTYLARAIHNSRCEAEASSASQNDRFATIDGHLLDILLKNGEAPLRNGLEDLRFRASGGTLCVSDFHEVDPQHYSKLQPLRDQAIGQFRLIVGTNLSVEVLANADKDFGDVLSRVSGTEVFIPPLRDRSLDIALGVIREIATSALRSDDGKTIIELESTAAEKLLMHVWTGNSTELSRVIGHAVNLSSGGVIGDADIVFDCVSRARGGAPAIIRRHLPVEIISLEEHAEPVLGNYRWGIFDVDGTLLLTEPVHMQSHRSAIRTLLDRELRHHEWDLLSQCFGPPDLEAYRAVVKLVRGGALETEDFAEKFQGDDEAVVQKLVDIKTKIFLDTISSQSIEEIWGARDLLDTLFGIGFKGRLAYCTGSPRPIIRELFGRAELNRYFIGGICAAEDLPPGLSKPHPWAYKMAAKNFLGKELPGICFENTDGGALAAAASGGQAFLLATDTKLSDELERLERRLAKSRELFQDGREHHPIVYLPATRQGWSVLADRIRAEHWPDAAAI